MVAHCMAFQKNGATGAIEVHADLWKNPYIFLFALIPGSIQDRMDRKFKLSTLTAYKLKNYKRGCYEFVKDFHRLSKPLT